MWVAILLIPLMVIAALAIDVAGMHADRQRLQTGADAAALAVALDCAQGDCGEANGTAERLADANSPFGGEASVADVTVYPELSRVEVSVESDRTHWFVPGSTDLAAYGAAAWNTAPSAARSPIPFAFAECELVNFGVLATDVDGNVVGLQESAIGQRFQLDQSQVSPTGVCNKTNSGLYAPGGFGWLAPDYAAGELPCSVHTRVGENVGSGNGTADSACYTRLQQEIVRGNDASEPYGLLPVFSTADQANNAKNYRIMGYIAVTLEGYCFHGNREYGLDVNGAAVSSSALCKNPGNGAGWITIMPQRFVSTDAEVETDPGAPNLGVVVITLELPNGGTP
ncbi:pilus assembly protein TadG-related protein [Agrococcus baldri]|uniref:pilus assembly protein TadG-related protein n=1 Tax=Agrococcus baldri TaxID=153730 RepID=UPI0015A61938|nr:Tad domain-containing protein [Agrococcus baldri]